MQVLSKDIGDGAILGGAAKLVNKTAELAKKVKVEGQLVEDVGAGHVNEKVISAGLDKLPVTLTDTHIEGIVEKLVGSKQIIEGTPRELAALEIRLAWKQLETQKGTVMAGAGHVKPIRDVSRIIAIYGGKAEDWSKMTSGEIPFKDRLVLKPNTKMQLHWYENVTTGQRVEFKPVVKSK